MTNEQKINLINEKAKAIRKTTWDLALSVGNNGTHFGSTFSIAEIMAALYCVVMKHSPENTDDPNRDKFILSKGHGSIALYVILAECGYYSRDLLLNTFKKKDSIFQAHPSRHPECGIEFSTGSLGHGLSIGIGCAVASKLDKFNNMIYVLCGDGECQEGSIWEAAMLAPQLGLDNLTVIVDYNRMQCDGFSNDIIFNDNMAEKWKSFGWTTIEVDGHDPAQLLDALNARKRGVKKPTAIIAHTVKGKGFSLSENDKLWHHKVINQELYEQALAELGC